MLKFHPQYKLYILNLAGSTIATFSPDRDPGLGIRCVAWNPNGMFLAVGGWDDKGPYTIQTVRFDATKASPKSGAVQMEWNVNGGLLCVRFACLSLALESRAQRHPSPVLRKPQRSYME
ncbi:hypothetical protein C0991_005109 [Blastosporella zonata]|nr:hypothetical protein C0991_005109 [Blastosporella zonata]